MELNLPLPLEKYRQELLKTVQPFVRIETSTIDVQLVDHWWSSHFGGYPYLPKGTDYPLNSQGNPLYLLAQINFTEVPSLPNFPDSGILQFYIGDDNLYGADFAQPTEQKNFRILYFPSVITNPDELITNFDFLPDSDLLPLPENIIYRLHFTQDFAPISSNDYQFTTIVGEDFWTNLTDEENDQIYDNYYRSSGHKLGGYPFFTQEDPRYYHQNLNTEPYILLLQIDSEGKMINQDDYDQIMWGDVGVANFFIQPSKLKNKDFSQVWYNWDCS